MATSGEIGNIELTLQEILDAAFRACRIVPQNVSPEMLENAQSCLQRMLNALPARAVPLWARDHKIIAFPVGQRALPLPVGTIDVVSADRRTYSPWAKTFTDNEGVLDYDLGSSCRITVLGYRPVATSSATIEVSTSPDGIVYTPRWAPGTASYTADVMAWFELEPIIEARYVRLLGVAAAAVSELFIGGSSRDVEIRRCNHDDYVALPDSSSPGMPHQYWLDRQAGVPKMRLWPVPDSSTRYTALSLWRQRYIEDVGSPTQTLEIPARWEESLIASLAYRVAVDTPQVDISVIDRLKPLADEFTSIVTADERDSSPIVFQASIRGYTR